MTSIKNFHFRPPCHFCLYLRNLSALFNSPQNLAIYSNSLSMPTSFMDGPSPSWEKFLYDGGASSLLGQKSRYHFPSLPLLLHHSHPDQSLEGPRKHRQWRWDPTGYFCRKRPLEHCRDVIESQGLLSVLWPMPNICHGAN